MRAVTKTYDNWENLSTFPNFPLRSVLRFGKWFAARVTVDLWASPFGGEDGENFFFSLFSDTRWEFQSHSFPPVILDASKEARTLGLKLYFLEFEIDGVKEQDGVYVDLH